MSYPTTALHGAVALALVLTATYLFRRLARLVALPGVVGEITPGWPTRSS
ncbi:hypothetical protein KIF24_09905 [Micromonospora sp. Llam7]|nr:hypothetical protein [Micromonospora tarapacensis]MBX7266305.1 hypothetical protein [Micromonospora tarapacensis]